MKILLVGDYPPPYGGVSVQVSVLCRLLSDMPGYTCGVLDIGKSRSQRRLECLATRNPLDFAVKLVVHAVRQYTIHLHTNGHNLKSWLITLACAAAGMFNGRRTLVSIGSGLAPDFIQKANRFRRALIWTSLTLTGGVICRNERTKIAMMALGVPTEKIAVISGFYGLKAGKLAQAPNHIEEFVRNHSPVIGAMASAGPEYGIHLLLEAATRLRPFYPRLGVLLVGVGEVQDHSENQDHLVTGQLPHDVVLGVLQKMDLFVRPTYFDGDASSVREALALGVPVVASDTDYRPEGVILFRRGDVGDLAGKIVHALKNGHDTSAELHGSNSDSFERLLALYQAFNGRAQLRRELA